MRHKESVMALGIDGDLDPETQDLRNTDRRLHLNLRSRLANAEETLDCIAQSPVRLGQFQSVNTLLREVYRLREQLYSWQALCRAALEENLLTERAVSVEIQKGRPDAS